MLDGTYDLAPDIQLFRNLKLDSTLYSELSSLVHDSREASDKRLGASLIVCKNCHSRGDEPSLVNGVDVRLLRNLRRVSMYLVPSLYPTFHSMSLCPFAKTLLAASGLTDILSTLNAMDQFDVRTMQKLTFCISLRDSRYSIRQWLNIVEVNRDGLNLELKLKSSSEIGREVVDEDDILTVTALLRIYQWTWLARDVGASTSLLTILSQMCGSDERLLKIMVEEISERYHMILYEPLNTMCRSNGLEITSSDFIASMAAFHHNLELLKWLKRTGVTFSPTVFLMTALTEFDDVMLYECMQICDVPKLCMTSRSTQFSNRGHGGMLDSSHAVVRRLAELRSSSNDIPCRDGRRILQFGHYTADLTDAHVQVDGTRKITAPPGQE